jgi:hypothetical protein
MNFDNLKQVSAMKTILSISGLIFFYIIITGCDAQENLSNFDYGTTEENIYSNSFFDFTMTLPADWVLQSVEETENIMEEGRKLVAGDDKNLESVLKAAEINTANLLVIYQYEMGAAVDYNPSLMLMAENLRNAPGIKNGADYLFHARKFLSQGQIQYDHLDEEFEKVDINGMTFHLMNTNINYMGYDIKQKYYSTVLNGFSLNMIITYVYDDQKSELEQSINSLTFEL